MTLKRKLTREEKDQIYSLHNQGLSVAEIADHLHIDNPQQVAGVVRAGINFNKIKPRNQAGVQNTERPAPIPMPLPQIQMAGSASAMLEAPPAPPLAPAPAAPQVQAAAPSILSAPVQESQAPSVSRPVHLPRTERAAAPAQTMEPQADFSGWNPVMSHTGGFNNAALAVRYMVYRDEPADGIVGEHTAPFTEMDLCRTYGRGLYRVQRFDPGNPRPFQTSVRVSEAFGESRFARQQNAAPARPNWSRFGRPWARPTETATQDEETRPMERPSIYDYARHAPASDAAVEAIKAMGQMNVKSLELNEQARRQGPDSFMAKFFQEQQERDRQQLEAQRRQDEQRRRDEEEKWERRQKEAELEHKRRQDDEERRHDREIAKIKAESEARAKEAEAVRKQLLDIEAQKLRVIEEQNKARQDALQEELKRNREAQKEQTARLEKQLGEMQNATAAQMQEHQERLEKEMQREREQLDREHKLREKSLDKERELENKVLDIKSTQLEAQGTNEIFQVVNNVINKFSSAVGQIVELKKLEAMTPEAQAAAVNKGHIDGNVLTDPKKPEAPQVAKGVPAAAAAAAAPPGDVGEQTKTGNGQAAAPAGEAQEVSMKEMIREMVDRPFFKEVIEEWAMHVKTEQDGTTFLNMYREWMCDPGDHEGRKATTMFANFIAPRAWEDFYGLIKDKLDKKIVAIFDLPHAKTFYETFRSLLTEQIRAFWEEFAQQREAVNAGRRAAEVPVK